MYSQNSKDKALGVLRPTGDVEKTARMSGVPGRTPRRWAAAAAKRGTNKKLDRQHQPRLEFVCIRKNTSSRSSSASAPERKTHVAAKLRRGAYCSEGAILAKTLLT